MLVTEVQNSGGQETWTSVLLFSPSKSGGAEKKRGQKKRDLHSNWYHFQLGSAITIAFVSQLFLSKGGEEEKKSPLFELGLLSGGAVRGSSV